MISLASAGVCVAVLAWWIAGHGGVDRWAFKRVATGRNAVVTIADWEAASTNGLLMFSWLRTETADAPDTPASARRWVPPPDGTTFWHEHFVHDQSPGVANFFTVPRWWRWGFYLNVTPVARTTADWGWNATTFANVVIPQWIPITPVATIPIFWMMRRRLIARRPPGTCRRCGYDLRASPGRCPECGTMPEIKPPTASAGDCG